MKAVSIRSLAGHAPAPMVRF